MVTEADDRLVPVRRHVPGANVAAAMRALSPTDRELARGYCSAIPSGTRLISLDVHRSSATVDLTGEFGSLSGSEQVLAVAQV